MREGGVKTGYDIAVVGSGFAGSLLAMIAKKLGHSVILLESSRHPRFAIGESSTPLANLLLEELTTQYNLPRIAPLAKWGTWQAAYPGLSCGLKRGFSFFHHSWGKPFETNLDHKNQLLVAASPHDGIADIHWYRAELDEFLAHSAQQEGVDFLDEVRLERASETSDGLTLEGSRQGCEICIRASFVVDASGPRGFLHQAFRLSELKLPKFPATQSLFSHFTGVRQFSDSLGKLVSDAPFAIDDAALHHVFPGGWIWVLRFNNGITSAGVAAVDRVAERYCFAAGASAWHRLLHDLPSVREQFVEAQATRSFTHARRVAFRSSQVAGRRWALLPSASGFVDPLLSTGFPLTLLGITRLAKCLEYRWNSQEFAAELGSYAQQTDVELLASSRLIGSLYASMNCSSSFSDLTLLYFAAASYSETARRLGKAELASSFLLHDHRGFGPASHRLLTAMSADRDKLSCGDIHRQVLDTIAPINVAGLGNAARRNWYPVDAEDLLKAAGKLQSSRGEIQALLNRSGFWERRV